jgi:hypothetical protein
VENPEDCGRIMRGDTPRVIAVGHASSFQVDDSSPRTLYLVRQSLAAE